MLNKDRLAMDLTMFFEAAGGIGGWKDERSKSEILDRLVSIDTEPLSRVQLNQLLVLCHEAPVSEGFFSYYWFTVPERHPYDVTTLPGTGYHDGWINSSLRITTIEQLKWGFYRLFVDALLWFGDILTASRALRTKTKVELTDLFSRHSYDTKSIVARGPALPLRGIPKDDRYLIAEVAGKSYGETPESRSDIKDALLEAFDNHRAKGGEPITIKELLMGETMPERYHTQRKDFMFSLTDVADVSVSTEEQLLGKYVDAASKFVETRDAALDNTRYYLSMVGDLDVYVATSMRNRQDFRDIADTCEHIFGDERLKDLHLRYFDPTLSAAKGHEDKGLIECLMVKCAKVLIYNAGERDSYGKDAEAAMALSLGKPVIFLCNQERKRNFYRDVHPLGRLINFETGVPVGALVAESFDEVVEILGRLFRNNMQYKLVYPKQEGSHIQLREQLTDSVVRLQTCDRLLAETFWNHYHNRQVR